MRLVKVMTLVLAVTAIMAPRGSAAGSTPEELCACANLGCGSRLRETALTLRKLGGRLNDDTVRFRAVVPLSAYAPAIDPATTGVRLMVLDNNWTSDDVVLDVAAPGGPDWMVNADGQSWSYRSSDVGTSAIKRATVKEIEPNPAYFTPRALLITIDARRGAYDATSDLESHFVRLAFAESDAAEVCADLGFYPWLFTGLPGVEPWEAEEWEQSCKFRGKGRTLECTTGPRVGPCRVSWPGDMMVCDAQNAAAAQEQYRSVNGSYYTGACEELPGFAASPNVTCTTSGTTTAFSVSTDHVPQAGYYFGCTWSSTTTPNLFCN